MTHDTISRRKILVGATALDAVGLAVPGMPFDSPGMGPESERAAYNVFLTRFDGSTEVFTSYAAA